MAALLATLPILLVLGLMIGLRWSAGRAGMAGAGVALVVAVGPYGLGTRIAPELGIPIAVGGTAAEAVFVGPELPTLGGAVVGVARSSVR
ncbi:hypothetical protein ER308_03640 [Egibacter rhizosphaerae]|uniref:L-lactate permease n=1 Tax=Egibacter rhizosphaerae TaxID=1670831 RepID=A0A411YBX2_9ACTN|nr:hypothetical protein [Egibacter rhizosphaerae]QBI18731.1 hypothetical protein ER308_03640 [Egibacter rhizosphaerae]